jgi:hypothetical protein
MSVISASVGKLESGGQCYNVVADQNIVIGLLNSIGRAQGGRREQPVPGNPRWGVASPDLHAAILQFQRTNRLSVDGHIDPGQTALRRLDELASQPSPLTSVRTSDLPEAIRRNPDYVERRVQGVGILGLGGPFRLDLGLDARMMPTRSFFMDRSRFNLRSDPFAGNAEIALSGIYPSQEAALAAIQASAMSRPGFVVYTHYRGPENIIFPTTMSATTVPALTRALNLAVDDEVRYASAASDLLLKAFFTLAGLRYLPVATEAAAPAAAGDLAALRQTAQTLLRSQPAGRAVVNLAGTGDVAGAINVNPLTAQQVTNIPNLIRSGAEAVGEIFPRASVDRIVSNDVVFGQVNWVPTARGCFTILRPGGTVSIAPYAGQLAEQLEAVATALRSAGFRDVAIQAGRFVTAVRP